MNYTTIALLAALLNTSYNHGMDGIPFRVPDETEQLVTFYLPLDVWQKIIAVHHYGQVLKQVNRFFNYLLIAHGRKKAPIDSTNITKTLKRQRDDVLTLIKARQSQLSYEIGKFQLKGHVHTTDYTQPHQPITTTAARVLQLPDTTEKNTTNATDLYFACVDGDVPAVIAGLDTGLSLDQLSNLSKPSPLHIAARHGHVKLIHALLKRDMPIDIPDANNTTPLIYAVQHHQLHIVKELHRLGADLNRTDGVLNTTPLYYAMQERFLPMIQYLIENGANLAHIRKLGDTLLHTAIESDCDSTIVDYILSKQVIPINRTSAYDETALVIACKKGRLDLVLTLIAHGADVNCGTDRKLPCNIAYENRRFTIVTLLLTHGARHTIKIPDHALLHAIGLADEPWVRALLALRIQVTEHMIELALRGGNTVITNLLCNAVQ